MCGIAGIINKSGEEVDNLLMEKMCTIVSHRGPDGVGYFYDKNLAFGHRRLSIIDLSDNGSQPMDFLGKYKLIFNGEIYNYIELRDELVSEGVKFSSNTDSEIILAAYDKWGEDCVKYFNGMWSFAIYDIVKKRIFCSRDRHGIKPFYYRETYSYFAFSSEIKQLLLLAEKNYPDINILMDYITLGYIDHTDNTFFTGVKQLLPAHNLVYNIDSGLWNTYKYYELKEDNSISLSSLDETKLLFEKELKRAVNYQLRSDVKVGTCLSGGLDSSTIAYFASNEYKGDVQFSAITAGSIDPANDETGYAKMVAESLDLKWITTIPDAESFLSHLEEIIYLQEEPFGGPSIIMQYFVMKAARENGIKVLLDGQGGDELLLGYERYYVSYLNNLPISSKFKEFLSSSENSKLGVRDLLLYLVYFKFPFVRKQFLKRKSSFIKKKWLKKVNFRIIDEISEKQSDIFSMQKSEIERFQLLPLLKYEDRNSMWNSIEARLPFLDYKLVELSLALPLNHKIKDGWTKYILRTVISGKLPDEIVWRKNKVGFESPMKIWLRNKTFKSNFVEHVNQSIILKDILDISPEELFDKGIDEIMLWRIFNVAMWEKLLNVSYDSNQQP